MKTAVLLAALVLLLPSGAGAASSFSIEIPRLKLKAPLSYTTRDYGPQVYYQDNDTLGIAGHRVTHTHPFYYINLLRKGDRVLIRYGRVTNVYSVQRHAILLPSRVKQALRYPGLVMSACHPRHFFTYRYVVFAKLVQVRVGKQRKASDPQGSLVSSSSSRQVEQRSGRVRGWPVRSSE